MEGGDAQNIDELQRIWADVRRRAERVTRGQRDGKRQGERVQGVEGTEGCPQLQPFRQPGIRPEAEREVQKQAWKRITGKVASLEERDREVAEGEVG